MSLMDYIKSGIQTVIGYTFQPNMPVVESPTYLMGDVADFAVAPACFSHPMAVGAVVALSQDAYSGYIPTGKPGPFNTVGVGSVAPDGRPQGGAC